MQEVARRTPRQKQPTGFSGTLPTSVAAAVLQVLTTGSSSAYCTGTQIGGNHGTRAIGYATVDVVASCNILLPTDPTYYGPTGLLYDNVLIGDYQQIGPSPSGSSGTAVRPLGSAPNPYA